MKHTILTLVVGLFCLVVGTAYFVLTGDKMILVLILAIAVMVSAKAIMAYRRTVTGGIGVCR